MDYWRSMVDVIIALLLVVLLVMSLLLLQVMDQPTGDGEVTEVEPTPTASPTPTPSPTPVPEYTPTPTPYWYQGGGYGGGGYNTPVPTFTPGPTAFISEYDKSAVRVVVVDDDSGLQLRTAGITFDLLTDENENLTLKVYYPQTQSYTLFETQQDGSFYLPQKLEPGTYVLRAVSVPDVYDLP